MSDSAKHYYCELKDVKQEGMFGGFTAAKIYALDGGEVDVTVINRGDRIRIMPPPGEDITGFYRSYVVGFIESGVIYPYQHQPETPKTKA